MEFVSVEHESVALNLVVFLFGGQSLGLICLES
jgi:hypothetical protein